MTGCVRRRRRYGSGLETLSAGLRYATEPVARAASERFAQHYSHLLIPHAKEETS